MAEEETIPLPVQPVPAHGEPASVTDSTRFIRMSLRPPARFAAGADFKLWLTRFEMYVQQAKLPKLRR